MTRGAVVLLLFGGGSIKNNGVYDQVRAVLKDYAVFPFGGIEANPRYETCVKAVDFIKRNRINFLLAVGGGSVLDSAKFMALAARYTESDDPWDFMAGHTRSPGDALPIGCVMTLAATGSEMNSAFVISRASTKEKLGASSYAVYPRFSILDPEVTATVPRRQVVNGIVDIFIHVTEQYVTCPEYAPLQDRQAEALLSTVVEQGPKALAEPDNYDVRATLMWCATQALNGTISRGVPQDWSTHTIAQEITALYGLDHAPALAVVLFGLWEDQFENKKDKLAQFGRRVWGLDGSDVAVAHGAIARTEAFFRSLGMPTRFSEHGLVADEVARMIAGRFAERGLKGLGERQAVNVDQISAILAGRA